MKYGTHVNKRKCKDQSIFYLHFGLSQNQWAIDSHHHDHKCVKYLENLVFIAKCGLIAIRLSSPNVMVSIG